MAMAYDSWNHLTGSIEHVATVFAILVGAMWAYLRFMRQREGHGRMDLTADLTFIGRKGRDWVVEIVARVENKGLVRHWISEFIFRTRYLGDGDPTIHGGPEINGQLAFPQRGDNGSFFPKDWERSFIEAGGCNVYRFVSIVPESARFVLVYERFSYQDRKSDFHTSQRVFAVPPLPASDDQPVHSAAEIPSLSRSP
jgi:hypothetical protein